MANVEEIVKPENLEKAQTYIDFVKKNLEPLAEHLKVGVDWLWDILVQQVRVEAIVYLIIVILLTVKSIVLLVIAFKALKKAKFRVPYGTTTAYKHKKTGVEIESELDDWEHRTEYQKVYKTNKTNTSGYVAIWCGIVGVALSVVSAMTMAATLPKIVTGLVNPEYGALERVIEFSKGQTQNMEAEKK